MNNRHNLNNTSLFSVPVIRPQDLATKGAGKIISTKETKILCGENTEFIQQVGPRDMIVLSKTVQLPVVRVLSDTELELKNDISPEAIELISKGAAYKIIPHIDQSTLYEKVHERLDQGESLVIFPEGGSHDRTEMLPLKGKKKEKNIYKCICFN